MTGDEYTVTGALMQAHSAAASAPPRAAVCAGGTGRAAEADSYVVLGASRYPTRIVMRGPWWLYDELAATDGAEHRVRWSQCASATC